MIECNMINQNINELLIAFANCNKIKNSDLVQLVELVAAVYNCANGGTDYGEQTTIVYEPLDNQIVNFPINSFHSFSIMVLEGNITETTGLTTVTYPTGTVLNTEFTNLNQTPIIFTVTSGSKVVLKYLTQTT